MSASRLCTKTLSTGQLYVASNLDPAARTSCANGHAFRVDYVVGVGGQGEGSGSGRSGPSERRHDGLSFV